MILPIHADDAFLADVEDAVRDPSQCHLWWLGQSGYLLAHAGRRILLDPYLSDSLERKYAGTSRPHERMTARVVAPERLAFADVVTASHRHTDHLDAETLGPLFAAGDRPVLVAPRAERELALTRAEIAPERLVDLDGGETAEVAGLRIRAVLAAHESIERDEQGCSLFLGYVLDLGGLTIYHAGDTVPYDGMAEAVGPVHVALLPINGRDPSRGVAGNLDGEQAAQLARALPAALAIPCHYDMFAFNTVSPAGFAAACDEVGQRYRILRPGERATLSAG